MADDVCPCETEPWFTERSEHMVGCKHFEFPLTQAEVRQVRELLERDRKATALENR